MISVKPVLIIGAIVLIALFVIPYGASQTRTGESDITIEPGCQPKKIPLRLEGSVTVNDKNALSLLGSPEPIISQVGNIKIAQNYFGLIKTDYVLNAALIQNGKIIGQAQAIEETIWNNPSRFISEDVSYELIAYMPDNNCDGLIDPFRAQLVLKLSPEGQVSQQIEKTLQFARGRVTLS